MRTIISQPLVPESLMLMKKTKGHYGDPFLMQANSC